MPPSIPKRIIQTGKEGQLPVLLRAAVSNVKLLNPDFEYLFFNDEQVEAFFKHEFPEYRETIESFQFPIQKFDFFRYLAIYRYGGFYLDLDVFLASNLSPLLDCGCVFSFEDLNMSRYLRRCHGMDWAVGNYAFGAAPGHPFLKAIIENCVRAQKDPGWVEPMLRDIPRLFRPEFLVLNTTGPTLVSRTLAENPALAETVTVLFPDDVCEKRNRHHFGSYGVHLMNASWRKHYNWTLRRLASMWEVWTYHQLLKESRKLGKTRQVVPNGKVDGVK
jgi:mannosyltransferase OCH1-like enzyme